MGNTEVALVIITIDADALAERVTVGIGHTGDFAAIGAGVEGIARIAGAIACIVNIAVGWAGHALTVQETEGTGADTVPVGTNEVGWAGGGG